LIVDTSGRTVRDAVEEAARTSAGGDNVKKRIAVAASAVLVALTFSGTAAAGIDDGPGRGNPAKNPAGKCPPGQNKTTSPGGLKKC
jgi:hypothetical protein